MGLFRERVETPDAMTLALVGFGGCTLGPRQHVNCASAVRIPAKSAGVGHAPTINVPADGVSWPPLGRDGMAQAHAPTSSIFPCSRVC